MVASLSAQVLQILSFNPSNSPREVDCVPYLSHVWFVSWELLGVPNEHKPNTCTGVFSIHFSLHLVKKVSNKNSNPVSFLDCLLTNKALWTSSLLECIILRSYHQIDIQTLWPTGLRSNFVFQFLHVCTCMLSVYLQRKIFRTFTLYIGTSCKTCENLDNVKISHYTCYDVLLCKYFVPIVLWEISYCGSNFCNQNAFCLAYYKTYLQTQILICTKPFSTCNIVASLKTI